MSSGVGEHELEPIVTEVNRFVKHLLALHFVAQEVVQAILGKELLPIVVDGQPFVQVSVVPHHLDEVLRDPLVIAENAAVKYKRDESARLLIAGFNGKFTDEFATIEQYLFRLSVAKTLHFEVV